MFKHDISYSRIEFFDPHVDNYFDHYNVILYLNEMTEIPLYLTWKGIRKILSKLL